MVSSVAGSIIVEVVKDGVVGVVFGSVSVPDSERGTEVNFSDSVVSAVLLASVSSAEEESSSPISCV